MGLSEGADVRTPLLSECTVLRKELNEYIAGLESHAEFEDTALFLFFKAQFPDFKVTIEALAGQHAELHESGRAIQSHVQLLQQTIERTSKPTAKQLEPIVAGIKEAVGDFHDIIIEHLGEEEMAILHLWLHLSEDQYKVYEKDYLQAAGHAANVGAKPVPDKQGKMPVLKDRYGNEVDPFSPGCCFPGVGTCCKGSAYRQLLAQQN
eukprot:NODE_3202_length_803_cov_54.786472_g2672_i0.p2 GENE.NODE_3202_length_803_cov_54.786472_g2672_i0~~NODE_3202_length_803_cov_54.786472_g2672_i0.p2  ORF type:complete len:231 (+),score=91.23 NODE_3202_length_803_cov_54.786472_g2672_i0:73-693(+)